MSEYIKREDALRKIDGIDDHDDDARANALGLAAFAVNTVPFADVVEVVRCKDCKFYEARQKGKPWNASRKYCSRSANVATQPDDYCSYGERKEQEHEFFKK